MKRTLLAAFTLFAGILLASPKADSTAPAAPAPQADQSFSMLFSSDPQYPWWRGETEDKPVTLILGQQSNAEMVRAMNAIQNLSFEEERNGVLTSVSGRWPSSIQCKTLADTDCTKTTGLGGAPVKQPSGLIINGDLTNFFHKSHWEGFVGLYYGIPFISEGVHYPIYLGLGNHDYKNNVSKLPGLSSGAFGSWGDGDALLYAYDYDRNGKEAVWHMAELLDGNPRVSNLDLNSYVSVKNSGGFDIRFFVKYPGRVEIFPGVFTSEVQLGSGSFEVTQRRGLTFPRGTQVEVEIQVAKGINDWYTTAVLKPPVAGATCFEVSGTVGNASWAQVPCIHERPTGSQGSLAYSFDVGNYHFVQLHYRPDYEYDMPERLVTGPLTTYKINESPGFTVTRSYNWLKADLEAATAAGKAIVLNMHDAVACDCNESRSNTCSQKDYDWSPCGESGNDGVIYDQRFKDAIAGQNVVAIFAGHIHEEYGLVAHALSDGGKKIPVFLSGSAEYKRFLVADFHRKRFTVGVVNSSFGLPSLVTAEHDEPVPGSISNQGNTTSPISISINRRPTVNASFDGPTPLEGSPVQFHVTGSDPDNDPLTYTWSFKDGDKEIGTAEGTDPVYTFPDGSKTYTVTVTADDGYDAGKAEQTLTVMVENVAPTITANSVTIDENGVATINGTITDPGVNDKFDLTMDWKDGSITTISRPEGARSYSISHQYLDDNPTGTPADVYAVNLVIKDNDGGNGYVDTTVTVRNVAPTTRIDKVLDDAGQEVGESDPVLTGLTLASYESYYDPGTRDILTATRDWGDATPIENPGAVSSNMTGSHIYQQAGQYQLTVIVRDDDAGVSSWTRPVRVVTPSGAMMQAVGDLSSITSSNGTAARALADAIATLNGNNAGAANNGALDQLARGNDNAALEKLEQSIQYLGTAEASDTTLRAGVLSAGFSFMFAPTSSLTRIKSLLTLTAKSVAVQAIARAEAAARNSGQRQQVAAAKASLAQGQSLLNKRDYTEAVRKFREALSKTNFAAR